MVISVLLRDLESRRQEQQLDLGREVYVAREVGDEALGQRALVEPIVKQAQVGALQVWLVGRSSAAQQPRLFPRCPAVTLRWSQGGDIGAACGQLGS